MAERKKYIEVKIPMLDSSIKVLGTVENLQNKTIKLDLTRKMRGKGLTVTFRILKENHYYVVPVKLFEWGMPAPHFGIISSKKEYALVGVGKQSNIMLHSYGSLICYDILKSETE